MEMQHATMLCSILIAIAISGCGSIEPKVEYVYVPQKCVVPETQEPIISNKSCEIDYNCTVVKVLSNYEAMKAYAESLKANSEVCK